MGWIRAAALSELSDGAVLGVEVAGRRIALARVDGEVYAISDVCSHRDFPLSVGEVDAGECTITCEWHGAAFSLRTGEPLCPPAFRPVPVFPARIEGADVMVEVE
ncbi:non-heme iron oxygenase ferredoxin subunit [Longimicrobium terrae]|uniref:Nitrite reductase/ring-hydroxylating ferredoxin subunit n=1 Tax=Longimicrobium terrae TaxID=1639882 RepID=A0A841H3J7_9BACT|nr:non-heme iron oxygenase ferredoxin subunit [Longimicrobium terrae]MBB4638383.1 nitrite reductase/ring-hydroxylating ferredoxin subunit [Longimicrobium terrae]MBB6072548.1 nitrite reductase/ring-hydroxylating ferredoxin subunit [Longimicrobium terrae]NNC28672.1 non-heme iron oxygenase ferredoxin subunit [Longimicrobium terrae]